jgi:lipopolysaccharide biosynthesis protein
MFWFRGSLMAPLFQFELQIGAFEAEKGQTDGTLAQEIERLIRFCVLKLNDKRRPLLG